MQEDPKISSKINYSIPRPIQAQDPHSSPKLIQAQNPFKPKTHSKPTMKVGTHSHLHYPFPHAKLIVGDIVEGNLASVHLEECVSGFCLQRGVECGFKMGRREREGFFLGLWHSEIERELRASC